MEQFIQLLQRGAAVMSALDPIVAAFVPGLEPIIKVAELAAKAGEETAQFAPLIATVFAKTSLTPDQKALLDSEYDRLSANLMRPASPPPGS